MGGWHGVPGPRHAGRIACRAYLISADQFADVTAQEMRRPPGGEFARALADLLGDIESVHVMGWPVRDGHVSRDYARMRRCSLLSHGDVRQPGPSRRVRSTARSISIRLREAHGWNPAQVASYLGMAAGVGEQMDAGGHRCHRRPKLNFVKRGQAAAVRVPGLCPAALRAVSASTRSRGTRRAGAR